ncbi:MAG: sulfatase [Halobacteriaceae archaeon]
MSDTDRPNVVLVTPHDLGQHVGCYGVDTLDTPNVDGLADRGARFENSFTATPSCSPARAAIATGRYPHQNGVMGLVHRNFAWDLADGERHLADLLGAAGYETALAGLQHEMHDPEQRFDRILTPTEDIVPDETIEYANVADHAGDFVRDAADPFYLQVGFVEPHRDPKWGEGTYWRDVLDDYDDDATFPEYLVDTPAAREEMAAYERAVELVDSAVGTILDALSDAGVRGETLVVFTTDHGMPLPRAKCSPYDPGIETALVVELPGVVESGVRDEPVVNVDYVPTILDLAGLSVPDNVQGRSFADLLTGGEYEPRDAVFGEFSYHTYFDPRRWVRTDEYKLVVNFTTAPEVHGGNGDPDDPGGMARFTDEFGPGTREAVELYELGADPLESENLAFDPDHREQLLELLDRLYGWMLSTEDPILEMGPIASPMHEMAMDALREGELRSFVRDDAGHAG